MALCSVYIGNVITVLGADLYFPSMYNGSMQGCTLGMLGVKRIHIISAYFLTAASDKRMRLLTSLYGSTNDYMCAYHN